MRSARGVVLSLLLASACGTFASAEPPEDLDVGDDASAPPAGEAGVLDPDPVDAWSEDAGVLVIKAGETWTSPNDAGMRRVDGGVQIVALGGATHPVILPDPPLAIPSETYTVNATVIAPADDAGTKEFGLLARGQADQTAMVFGSTLGSSGKPFLATIGPPTWDPQTAQQAPAPVPFQGKARYAMRLHVEGGDVRGKLWLASEVEPGWQLVRLSPWAAGSGVGFYTYGINGAVLEELFVTVP